MKKRYLIELICFVFLLILPFLHADKDVDFSTLNKKIKPYIIEERMEVSDDTKIYRNYHITNNDYDECFSYTPISYMDVEELTIFKVADENKRKVVFAASLQHIEKEIAIFKGYGIQQTELLKDAYVQEKGNYVIIVVHQKSDTIGKELEACF